MHIKKYETIHGKRKILEKKSRYSDHAEAFLDIMKYSYFFLLQGNNIYKLKCLISSNSTGYNFEKVSLTYAYLHPLSSVR